METSIVHSTSLVEVEKNDIVTIKPEDAEKKGNIFLSFGKINNFLFNKGIKTACFDLYVTTKNNSIKVGFEINVSVNMIHNNGTSNTFLTNFTCKFKDKKQHKNSYLIQFNCESKNLKGDYHSLRYNYSELISGIQNENLI